MDVFHSNEKILITPNIGMTHLSTKNQSIVPVVVRQHMFTF